MILSCSRQHNIALSGCGFVQNWKKKIISLQAKPNFPPTSRISQYYLSVSLSKIETFPREELANLAIFPMPGPTAPFWKYKVHTGLNIFSTISTLTYFQQKRKLFNELYIHLSSSCKIRDTRFQQNSENPFKFLEIFVPHIFKVLFDYFQFVWDCSSPNLNIIFNRIIFAIL